MSHYIHTFDVRLQLGSSDPRFDSALANFLAEHSSEEIKEHLFDANDLPLLLKQAAHCETFDDEDTL